MRRLLSEARLAALIVALIALLIILVGLIGNQVDRAALSMQPTPTAPAWTKPKLQCQYFTITDPYEHTIRSCIVRP